MYLENEIFNHQLISLPPLVREDTDNGRFYNTPDGNRYPSVTSIIGAMSDKSGLDVWRSKVGAEEADRVSGRAARRGTEIHRLCEAFVLNEEIDLRKEMPLNAVMFEQLRVFLSENVNDIIASELYLHSDKLKVAGAVDLVAKYRGVNAIIDFKTSARKKLKEWIEGYFIQTGMYAAMLYERTGIICPKLVVAIALEDERDAQIFVERSTDWVPKSAQMCKNYHEMKEKENAERT